MRQQMKFIGRSNQAKLKSIIKYIRESVQLYTGRSIIEAII